MPQDRRDQLELVPQVLKVQPGIKVALARRVLQALVSKVQLAHKVQQAIKDIKGIQGLRDQQDLKGIKVQQDLRVIKAHKLKQDPKVPQV